MDIIDKLRARARKNPKKIVYPEAEDSRILLGANRALAEGIINEAVLLGDENNILNKIRKLKLNAKNYTIINPSKSEKIKDFTDIFYELRKHKDITRAQAISCIKDNLIFGGLLTRTQRVDGFIAGAVHTTKDTVKAAFYTLGLKNKKSIMSSFFIMKVPNTSFGQKGLFLYADCGVVVNPSAKQLANITKSTADAMKCIFNIEPKCALLSYSTKGSSDGISVQKVREAVAILQEKYPDSLVDGELQADAALCEHIAKVKAKHSKIQGNANILIFPDLNSGNIAYKLTQRLANATTIGPILVGLKYPANDLSRGCSVDDIVNVTAVTVLQK